MPDESDSPDRHRSPAAEAELSGGGSTDGPVDHSWVMQTTFVVAILAGVPLVTALSLFVSLPTWESMVGFAARVGAAIWLVIAISTYAYARFWRDPDPEGEDESSD